MFYGIYSASILDIIEMMLSLMENIKDIKITLNIN